MEGAGIKWFWKPKDMINLYSQLPRPWNNNGVDLAELLRRRDELRFLALQCDPEKATEDLRYSCIKGELAEVERKLSVLA